MPRGSKRTRVAKDSPPCQRIGTCYEPPPRSQCETVQIPVIVDTGTRLVIKKTYRRSKSIMVAFAVTISIKDSTGEWLKVWRMDTWHGTVHTHQYDSNGNVERMDLEAIPAANGPDVIERWCTQVENRVQYEWQEYIRRWKGDGK